MITLDQLKDIQDRADALYKYLDIDRKKMEYEEEDLRTQAPDFWEDPVRAQEQMKLVKGIKKWIDGYNEVRTAADELQLSFDFYKDELVTEEEVDAAYERAVKAIDDLELRNMLRQEEDPMDCVLKINLAPAAPRLRTGRKCLCACTRDGLRRAATRSQSPTFRKGMRQESSLSRCRLRAESMPMAS